MVKPGMLIFGFTILNFGIFTLTILQFSQKILITISGPSVRKPVPNKIYMSKIRVLFTRGRDYNGEGKAKEFKKIFKIP